MSVRISVLDCRHQYLSNSKLWLHAVQTGRHPEVVGSISLSTPDGYEPGIWVNDLYVAPELRRRGIGAMLLHAALEQAAILFPNSRGCGAGIRETNADSQRLFEAAGFEHVGDYPDDPVRLYERSH